MDMNDQRSCLVPGSEGMGLVSFSRVGGWMDTWGCVWLGRLGIVCTGEFMFTLVREWDGDGWYTDD